MTDNDLSSFVDAAPTYIALLVVAILWSTIWKAFALYRAGKVRQPVWFAFLLVLNTLGILEILYLFVFSKKANKEINSSITYHSSAE